jgi:hypothetical protein
MGTQDEYKAMKSPFQNTSAAAFPSLRCEISETAPQRSERRRGLVFRFWHQLAHEWRAQFGLVLLWWAAVAFQIWQTVKGTPSKMPLPDWTPAALALLIVVRSVLADAPLNAEVNTHTRPIGRGAVALAKLTFFNLTLLLPWIVQGLPECCGFGFGAAEWFWIVMSRILPALALGSFTLALACGSGSGRKNVILGGIGIALCSGHLFLEPAMKETDALRCAWAVAAAVWSVTMLWTWWQISLARRSWPILITGCLLTLAALCFWRWDWCAQPERLFTESKLTLHIGEPPAADAQELWPGLSVKGLPADHVVSIISLTPQGGTSAYSDYTETNAVTGESSLLKRWMRQAHTRALMPHYPAGSLWHGNVDRATRTPLQKIVGEERQSWQLKLAVQRMTKLATLPLNQINHQQVLLTVGHRLDFQLKEFNNHSWLNFDAVLKRCLPLLEPHSSQERLKLLGEATEDNFLILLHSPSIREVRTASESNDHYWPRDGLLERRHKRPVNFSFAHPRPQMDIAGLKLQDWLNDSTLDLWWPLECGVVELEISAADMERLIEMK